MHNLNDDSAYHTIIGLLRDQAQRQPDKIAILAPDRQGLTYGALLKHVEATTHMLSTSGLHRNDRVAIVLPGGSDMAAAFLSIGSLATCVLLNPVYRLAEFEFYLSVLHPKVVVVQTGDGSPVVEAANRLGIPVIRLTPRLDQPAGLFSLAFPPTLPPIDSVDAASIDYAQPDDLLLILHTSGTTGRPKIVPLTHANQIVVMDNQRKAFNLQPSDRSLCVMPLFHTHGLITGMLSSILSGGSVFMPPGFNASRFFEWLEMSEATWYSAVPTFHQAILMRVPGNREIIAQSHLRFIRSASAALSPKILYEMEAAFNVPVIEAYGSVEAAAQVTCNPLPPSQRKAGSIGLPAGMDVAIMDAQGHLLPSNTPGEIVARGPSVMQGYENNPEANAQAFVNGWFRSGDLGYYDEDGYFYIMGRIKEQINRGGEKISPQEVDDVLLEHPAVVEAVAFAIPHPQLGEDVAAAVVLHEGTNIESLELREFVARKLADFKVPQRIIFVTELPKGPTGKIQRIGLADRLGIDWNTASQPSATSSSNTAINEAISPAQACLVTIWQETLRVEQVGIYDNFFALGGDSILAAQMLSRAAAEIGIALSMVGFLVRPTIADMTVAEVPTATLSFAALSAIIPDPANGHEPFALTDIQEAYWVGREQGFELGNLSTHLYLEVDSPNLDLPRLQQALAGLIARHGMLRAIILPEGQQQILRQVSPYRVRMVELRGKTSDEAEQSILTTRQHLIRQKLAVDSFPLFRIVAHRLGDSHYRLHFHFDTLIMDGWSRLLFFYELGQLYHNQPLLPPTLELSFRDYVLAEKAQATSVITQQARDYWFTRLDTLPPGPELPLATAGKQENLDNAVQEFSRRRLRFEPEKWAALKIRGRQAGLTPSGILLTAYSEVLRLWSKNPEFTLNLTFFNRLPLHANVFSMLGDFTSLILLEVRNPERDTFEQRAQRLQHQLWQDLDQRFLNGVQVLRELAKQHTQSGTVPHALMPVVFTSLFTNDPRFNRSPLDWLGTEVERVSSTSQVWIDLQAGEEAGELICHWNSIESLFPTGLMADMFGAFEHLLTWLAEDEQAWQSSWNDDVDYLLPPEQRAQQATANATDVPIPLGLLHEPFLKQAAAHPEALAVIDGQRNLTYGDVARRSMAIARWLRYEGAQANTLIGIVMEKGWEQIVAALAILQAGAAYLPIDADLPRERIDQLLAHGNVSLVLTQTRVPAAHHFPAAITWRCVDLEPPDMMDVETVVPLQTQDDLAYVIYTSGSTGLPKGVMITHRAALNTIADLNERFKVYAGDRVLALSSLSFDLSVYDIFGVLGAGGTIVIPDLAGIRDPAHWADLLVRQQVTIWNSVPALMNLLADYAVGLAQSPLAGLRLVFLSGDWIPIKLPTQLRSLAPHASLISMGGATEASIWSIWYPINAIDPTWTSIPYGKPLRNQRFYVLDDQLAPRPTWTPGQLYIGGIGVAAGYWCDETHSNASFIVHPRNGERLYRTGDWGRYLPDGNIEFLGRDDSQVKIQGFRIETGEIEAALLQHGRVREVVVKAIGDPGGTRRLVAYVVAKGAALVEPELRDFLHNKLPTYMIPSQFVNLTALPLSANGKVDLKALPAPDRIAVQPALPLQDSDLIGRITNVVARVLEIERILPQTNLLALGATSMDMVLIVNAVHKELGFRITLDNFYRTPSIEGLADGYLQTLLPTPAVEISSTALPATYASSSTRAAIDDPGQREAFKANQLGLRRDVAVTSGVALPTPGIDILTAQFLKRHSQRTFSAQPVAVTQIANLLASLREITTEGGKKYGYGSAGGLYPVQVYVYIKPGRVEGVNHGVYYYHPVVHRLIAVSLDVMLDPSLYGPLINRPIFNEAAFAIFLIGQMRAIAPLYGEQSLHYAYLEAGAMAQLLEMACTEYGLGLCAIGNLDFEATRPVFALENSHVLLHSLVGGAVPTNPLDPATRLADPPITPSLLIPLKTTGSKPPLFLIHAMFGGVYFYRDWLLYLRNDQPVYGIQARGVNAEAEPLNNISAMADLYTNEILAVQPNGPYFLCGYSAGGRIAFEIARRLEATGRQVAFLALVDDQLFYNKLTPKTRRPSQLGKRLTRSIVSFASAMQVLPGRYKRLYMRERLHDIRWGYQPGSKPEPESANYPPHIQHIGDAMVEAVTSYIPQPYYGKVIYFRSQDLMLHVEAFKVLQIMAGGELEVIDVPGNHYTIVSPTNLPVLLKKLRDYLDPAIDSAMENNEKFMTD